MYDSRDMGHGKNAKKLLPTDSTIDSRTILLDLVYIWTENAFILKNSSSENCFCVSVMEHASHSDRLYIFLSIILQNTE